MDDTTEVGGGENAPDEGTSSRRFFGKAAIAAAVTTVAGLSMSRQAGAANGDTLYAGFTTTATNTTKLSGGTTLEVNNGTSSEYAGIKASVIGTNSLENHAGVIGTASGTTGYGVYGRSVGSSGRGVYGFNSGSGGVGVYGEHNNTSTSGTGVYGKSNFGSGVVGSGSSFDLDALGSGRVVLRTAGVANPPTGSSTVGTVARDSAGNVWVCVASGTPGTWRKVAGTATAGSFHAITPGRVYDSRLAQPAGSVGTIAAGQNRTVSVADQRDLSTGAVTTANLVPAGATAVTANITVVNTTGSGFLACNPGGVTTVSASTINWSAAGQILANGVTLTLNTSRQLTIVCGGTGATDFIVDISGYYL